MELQNPKNESKHEYRHLTIKELNEDDRPREKLKMKGVEALSDTELLALLIGSGTKDKTAIDLARELLRAHDNRLTNLASHSLRELLNMKIKGLGETRYINLMAAMELGRRIDVEQPQKKVTFNTSAILYNKLLKAQLAYLKHEEMWIILLNNSLNLIAKKRISQGGISETTIDKRLILKECLIHNTSNLVLSHNHPSGRAQPSQQDLFITTEIKQAAKLIGINLIDHLIVTKETYYSMADNGQC